MLGALSGQSSDKRNLMKNGLKNLTEYLFSIVLSFISSWYLYEYTLFSYNRHKTPVNQMAVLCVFAGIFLTFFFVAVSVFRNRSWLAFLYRHRVLLSVILLAVLVALNVSGSSVGAWCDFLQDSQRNGLLWGSYDHIRSDEWAVWTPLAIAQEYSGYSAVNDLVAGGTAAEWVSVGGVPALNLAAVFKPLYWGFFVLGSERGFSFLWNARFILLFLISFEAFKRLANQNKYLGLMGASLITFAPIVQWFFSQSIAEVIFFSEGILLCADELTRGGLTNAKRIALTALFGWQFGCLAMIGYPAWLIPQVYLIAAFLIILLYTRRRALNRQLVLGNVLSVAAAMALVLIVVLCTWDVLRSVRNSIYPGNRMVTGGTGFDSHFHSQFSALFFPFAYHRGEISFNNPCENASVISLFPMGVILSALLCAFRKKTDPFLAAALLLELVLTLFCCVGFPQWLARLTLLSNCPVARLILIFGLLNVILLIRSLAVMDGLSLKACLFLLLSCIGISAVWTDSSAFSTSSDWPRIASILIASVFFLMTAAYCRKKSQTALKALALALTAILGVSAICVNPIQRGFDVLDTELIRGMKAMEQTDGEMWISEGDFPLPNLPLLAGKPTLNSTQEYPDLERWAIIDPERKYVDCYNNFSHIIVVLGEEPTSFERVSGDVMRISLDYRDLQTLGITHLVTANTYAEDIGSVHFELLFAANGFNVYAISYR